MANGAASSATWRPRQPVYTVLPSSVAINRYSSCLLGLPRLRNSAEKSDWFCFGHEVIHAPHRVQGIVVQRGKKPVGHYI